MADANRLAAALRYQQDMEGPVTMNPNIAEQGRKGRANMAPPTSVMDSRSRDYERRAKETENFLIGADILAGALPFAPLAKGAVMAAGKYAGPELARGLENYMVKSGAVLPMDVWHGSGVRFAPTAKNPLGEFDPTKIGSGEGAQVFGYGHYTGEARDTGKEYAKNLANRDVANQGRLNAHANAQRLAKVAGDPKYAADDIKFALESNPDHPQQQLLQETLNFLESGNYKKPLSNQGYLYKVDLSDEVVPRMLDWDKPFSQQHPDVQAAVRQLHGKDALGRPVNATSFDEDTRGQWLYEALQQGRNQKLASQALREAGIPGIKYLDDFSRNQAVQPYYQLIRKSDGNVYTQMQNLDNAKDFVKNAKKQGVEFEISSPIDKRTRNFVVFPGNEGLLNILGRE